MVTLASPPSPKRTPASTSVSPKAVHIELVSELSTAAFLASFRFVACRGCPSEVYSDNGSNFRGAWREIKEAEGPFTTTPLSATSSGASHPAELPTVVGGVCQVDERRSEEDHRLTFEELTTVLTGGNRQQSPPAAYGLHVRGRSACTDPGTLFHRTPSQCRASASRLHHSHQQPTLLEPHTMPPSRPVEPVE